MKRLIVDQSAFDQKKKNLTHAAVSSILHERGIKHNGIKKNRDGDFDIDTVDEVVITEQDILTKFAEMDAADDAARIADQDVLTSVKARIGDATSVDEIRTILSEL